jgi:hypothetical protein
MGELEGRTGRLSRRADRLEEQAELGRQAERHETERMFRKALSRLGTSELRAMKEYMESIDREGWAEEDEPLIRRLLGLMEEVRREEAEARGKVVDPRGSPR